MYIRINYYGHHNLWDYSIYATNHRAMLCANSVWIKSACIRVAKKMARRLGIEYREVK